MLRLTYSNRSELNLARLAEEIRRHQHQRPLAPIQIVVPHRSVELWLRQGLAQALGVAANLEVMQLKRFVLRLVEARRADVPLRLIDAEVMLDQLLAAFFEPEALGADADLEPLARYFGRAAEASAPLCRFQMASALARLFDEYALSRDFLSRWERGERAGFERAAARSCEAWQAALWRLVRARLDALGARQACRYVLPGELCGLGDLALTKPTFLFGISHMALAYHRLVDHLARRSAFDLGVYALNPCAEFWEQLPAGFELGRRPARRAMSPQAEDGARPALDSDAGHPLLQAWGRPGRENVRVLNEVTGCDFEDAFEVRDAPATLLEALQQDILFNAPAPRQLAPAQVAADASLRILDCASVQRECEAIAGEIARALRGDASLRFGEVAVLVAGREASAYFTHLTSALTALQIPVCLSDLPIERSSRLAEAARLLADLPLSRFTRSDLIGVLSHPALRGHVKGLDRGALPALIDELGIFYGAERADQAESYLTQRARHSAGAAPRDLDLFNWDQGLKRLALGKAMRARAEGDGSPFEMDTPDGTRRCWPVAAPMAFDGQLDKWALLVRALIADARLAAEGNRPDRPGSWRTLGEWARFLDALLATYLFAEEDAEVQEREILRRAARAIGNRALFARGRAGELGRPQRVPYRIACELLRQKLDGLRGRAGNFLLDGVAISPFQPQCALPFRHIFVMGLGAGDFPGQTCRDPLDLRREKVGAHAGQQLGRFDVFERERAQYLFLETLLSAREHLVLSFVGRDQVTGSALDPSPVIADLERALRLYAPGRRFREVLPAQRSDLILFPSLAALLGPEGAPVPARADFPALPEARREATSLALRALLERLNPEGMARASRRGTLLTRADFDEIVAPLGETSRAAAWAIASALDLLPAEALEGADGARAEMCERALSISNLRGFLDNPAQQSAATLLQLRQERDEASEDALASLDDERFTFEDRKLERAEVLRAQISALIAEAPEVWRGARAELFQRAGACGGSARKAARGAGKAVQRAEAEAAFSEVAAPLLHWLKARGEVALDELMGAGKFPAGIFGQAEREKLFAILEKWAFGFMSLEGLEGLDFCRTCFGEADEFEAIGDRRPAIDLGDIGLPSGQKVRARLRGATGLIGYRGERPCHALFFKPAKAFRQADRLRGFVDLLACLAAGAAPPDMGSGFRCSVICGSGEAKTFEFSEISAGDARSYLRGLAEELLGGPNAYWLPGESVIASMSKSARATKSLRARLREARQCPGPLRQAEVDALPQPSDDVLRRALFPAACPAARWGFFVEHSADLALRLDLLDGLGSGAAEGERCAHG